VKVCEAEEALEQTASEAGTTIKSISLEKDAQFSGFVFPSNASFADTQFSGGSASFRSAQFSGGDANFASATFSGGDSDFANAVFTGDANFERAPLSIRARFKKG
jgi:uncharacterized protein YjbI with pentapeptide repeats